MQIRNVLINAAQKTHSWHNRTPELVGSVRLKSKNLKSSGVPGDVVINGLPLGPDTLVELTELDLEELDR